MEEKNVFAEENYVEINLLEIFAKLLKRWKLILCCTLTAAAVGIVFSYTVPKKYTVGSTLAPEVVARVSNSISTLAALSGINMSAQSTQDAVYPELYPQIISSIPFVTDMFSIPVEFSYKKEDISTDYYTYLRDYNRTPWWSTLIKAPIKAINSFRGLFHKKQPIDDSLKGYENLDISALTPEQLGVARSISKNIALGIDKKTSLISVSVTAQDPKVATKICQELIERIQQYVSAYRTEKSRKDLEYYQQLYDEAKDSYYQIQQEYADYLDANQDVILQRVKTERERLQNEMQQRYTLYNACAQQLQISKAKVQQETPVFTIINPPMRPLKASSPSKPKILVIFILLGLILSSAWVLIDRDKLFKLSEGAGEDSN